MSAGAFTLKPSATTTTPSAAALSLAAAEASSGVPLATPSDMLSTSRWSEGSPSSFGSVAQSIACVVSVLLPAHPNTRSAYSFACGATPGPILIVVNGAVVSNGPVYVVPSALTPYPAAVPETCEPWPPPSADGQSSGFGSGCGVGLNDGLVESPL